MPLTLVRPPESELARVAVLERRVVPDAPRRRTADDIVEEWGLQSFPASDPPANW
ncbi:hypothetical protein [Petropleomorpha daqingensis]|uniref:Uncharacterized protein n=1 Tax=Petropleomorpha daqingensis TaxID=2026353 RepID=A0A853CL14_9ACTN|nr:hypothetical protein [Petropleomorpha daqingensis]NYJ07232.1 hypothetical protein [Petropleomorpha daqingensis]